jgi:hypothetical protein
MDYSWGTASSNAQQLHPHAALNCQQSSAAFAVCERQQQQPKHAV